MICKTDRVQKVGRCDVICTVTLNAGIDLIVRLDSFEEGGLNRTMYERTYAGGKGLNVSTVLANLGVESRALGFVAGFTGAEIERQMAERKIACDFVRLPKGFSRINVKMKVGREETEINGMGPCISEETQEKFFQKLDALQAGDTLVLAGSIPSTMPRDTYEQILKRLQGRDVCIVVDAAKELLRNVLRYRPFLIKPNHHELGELFGVTVSSDAEIKDYAQRLQQEGARNVMVSMAGDGAFLLTEEGRAYRLPAPKGKVKNSVGAGDSMVAGFLAGMVRYGGDMEKAFRLAVAAGSASAFSDGLATAEKVTELLKDKKN